MNTQYNQTIQPHTKMLTLNIKSSSYMCLDIDPDSVIHEHLVRKTKSTCFEEHCMAQQETWNHSKILQSDDCPHSTPSHSLTMLPSFHISLGAPRDSNPKWFEQTEDDANYWLDHLCTLNAVPIIGDITLAPICISEKNNKKSAWIPLNPYWFEELNTDLGYYFKNYDSFDHRCDECPVQHLHVSVANLTGNPRDSIDRPEDCIIDTITN